MLKCEECSQNVKHTEELCATSCGHLHHSKCVTPWRTHFWSCNVCRSFPCGIHKIFTSFNNQAANVSEKARLKEQDAQLTALKAELAGSQQNCAQIQKKLHDFSTEYESVQQSHIYQIEKNIELAGQLEDFTNNLEAPLKEKDEEIAALKNCLQQSKDRNDVLQEAMEHCVSTHYEKLRKVAGNFELEAEIAALKNSLEKSQYKCTELQKQVKYCNTQYDIVQEDQIKMIAENEELREQLNKMKKTEKALQKKDAQIAALKKDLEGIQHKCAVIQGNMRKLSTENEALEKSNMEQLAKHFDLQEKFDEMNKSYQKMRKDEPSMRREIMQLKQKFSAEVLKEEEDRKQLEAYQKEWMYMGMSDSSLNDLQHALWEDILTSHWAFLNTKDNTEKINKRKQLEATLEELLWIVPHDRKFLLRETSEVLKKSVCEMEDFNASKALQGFKCISQYANNLLNNPWRKEFRLLKLYSGIFQHEIKSNLVDGEKLFEAMGYRKSDNETMVLSDPIVPEALAEISREAMIAQAECQIMQKVYIGLTKMGAKCSWREIYHYRERHVGGTIQNMVGLLHAQKRSLHLGKSIHGYEGW